MSYVRRLVIGMIFAALVAGAVHMVSLGFPGMGTPSAVVVDGKTSAGAGPDECDPVAVHGLHFAFAPSRLFADRDAVGATC